MTILRVDGLEHAFGSVTALDGMTFEVDAGECFGFLGPNGAGKTTTISVLTGQLTPDAGTVEVLGLDPTVDPVETRRRVGVLPEQQPPPSFLTPREFFEFVGEIREIESDTLESRIDTWARRLNFENTLETLTTDLSRGQQQKVMITQAFLHEPQLVFIDEPLVNLDPLAQEQVKAYLLEYVEAGNTVFVSTHNIDVAAAICDRLGIVVDGTCRLLEAGEYTAADLRDRFLETVERETPVEGDEDGDVAVDHRPASASQNR